MILFKYAPTLLVVLIILLAIFLVKSAVKMMMKAIIGLVLLVILVLISLNLQEIRYFVGDMVCSGRAEKLEDSQRDSLSITGLTPEMIYEGCMEEF